MRRRIRLTGRKQIAKSDATVKIIEIPGRRLLALTLADNRLFAKFPKESRVLVVLKENKLIELSEFGTLGALKTTTELKNEAFANPSCQLRIVTPDGQHLGMLLGSTDTWSLNADPLTTKNGKKGILCFQPDDIAPRAWKLDVRDNDYPVVYVDKRIPDTRTWVKTDPTFVAFVLPAIVAQVFDDILQQPVEPDADWMKDWLAWGDALMPGSKPPFGGTHTERKEWIELLIESFSARYRLSNRVVEHLTAEAGRQ